MSRRTRLFLLLAAAGGLGLGTLARAKLAAPPRDIHHVHGLAVDRRDSEVLYIATHTGLARARGKGAPEWLVR